MRWLVNIKAAHSDELYLPRRMTSLDGKTVQTLPVTIAYAKTFPTAKAAVETLRKWQPGVAYRLVRYWPHSMRTPMFEPVGDFMTDKDRQR